MRSKTFILLAIILLISLGLILILYSRSQKLEKTISSPPSTQIINQANNPIRKGTIESNNSVQYEIVGNFNQDLQVREDGVLIGNFIIKGDKLKRQLKTGILQQKVYYGEYEGAYTSKSTWKLTDTQEIPNLIKADQEVLMRVQLFADNTGKSAYYQSTETALDLLIYEFKQNKFEYRIPVDFVLSISGIGVIIPSSR